MASSILSRHATGNPFARLLGLLQDIVPASVSKRLFNRLPSMDSCERIRVNMLSKWLIENEGCTVIAFTSRHPGEGVSTVVAGLARSFGTADIGKVLVIQPNPEDHTVNTLLEAETTDAGPEGPGQLTRCEPYKVSILSLMEASAQVSTSRDNARTLIDKLRSSYQIILIDAGALTNSFSTYWLRAGDYRVMIIDSTVTTHEVLEHLRNSLDHLGISLDGTILNKRIYPIPKSLYWLAR